MGSFTYYNVISRAWFPNDYASVILTQAMCKTDYGEVGVVGVRYFQTVNK